MARTVPQPKPDSTTVGEPEQGDHYVTPEEGRRIFDTAARKLVGISGDEFIHRWETGEYWGVADDPAHRHIGGLILMIPFARQEP